MIQDESDLYTYDWVVLDIGLGVVHKPWWSSFVGILGSGSWLKW